MNKENFEKRFLTKTDETGRFIVRSLVTGKTWYVEPIDNTPHRKIWGDINPATKELEGGYGNKYKGSVIDEESLITKENGFDKIYNLPAGTSPTAYIDMLDKQYEEELKNGKE
jgi:hypothetical protein